MSNTNEQNHANPNSFWTTTIAIALAFLFGVILTLTLLFAFGKSHNVSISATEAIIISITILEAILAVIALGLGALGIISYTQIRRYIAHQVTNEVSKNIRSADVEDYLRRDLDGRFADDGDLTARFRDNMREMIATEIAKQQALAGIQTDHDDEAEEYTD